MGNPWFFRTLAALEHGQPDPGPPSLAERHAIWRRHAALVVEHSPEKMRQHELRKTLAWYSRGLFAGSTLRQRASTVADPAALQFGQYKTPYSRQELYNDGVLQFPERSLATDAFKPSRDIGMMAFGNLGKGLFTYQAGVFGGAGQSTLRTTENVMPVVRLDHQQHDDTGAGARSAPPPKSGAPEPDDDEIPF